MDRLIYVPKSVGDLIRFESPSSVTALLARFPRYDSVASNLRRGKGWLGYRVQDPKNYLKGYSDNYLQVLLRLAFENKPPEYVYRDFLLHTMPGAKGEVILNSGIVDVMTSTEVIEVKSSSNWKHALGQVLAYSLETGKDPVVALMGEPSEVSLKTLAHYGIKVLTLG